MCVLVLLLGLAACGTNSGGEISAHQIQKDTVYLCEQFGSRVTGTQQEREACDWLEKELETMGFSKENDTLRREGFQGLGELTSENLTARYNPGESNSIYCVVAHYDSIATTPGARDNASAVAILLEIARNLQTQNPDVESEIRLVFLGSEENGYHGSRAYLENLTQEGLERHKAVFNMDISAATAGRDSWSAVPLAVSRTGFTGMAIFWSPWKTRSAVALPKPMRHCMDGKFRWSMAVRAIM